MGPAHGPIQASLAGDQPEPEGLDGKQLTDRRELAGQPRMARLPEGSVASPFDVV